MKIKFDKRNYRKHNDKNKKLIKKSLNECGAGRSIVVDNEGEIIGGNGIYEAWGNKPIKVIETDGSELVVVKRTDLNTNDEKRKKLAIMDNSTSDSSEFDFDMLHADFDLNQLSEFGLPVEFEGIESYNNNNIVQPNGEQTIQDIVENLPDELKNIKLEPEKFEEIVQTFETPRERVIITYSKDKSQELARILGLQSVDKIVYRLEEILGEDNGTMQI